MGANEEEIVLYDNVNAKLSEKDEEKPKFFVGQKVELLEDIKNDGTYPHEPIGTLMMPKGAIGYVKKIDYFLQVIRVYEVHFLGVDAPVEIVGCREHELLALEDYVDEVEEELRILREHRAKYKKD